MALPPSRTQPALPRQMPGSSSRLSNRHYAVRQALMLGSVQIQGAGNSWCHMRSEHRSHYAKSRQFVSNTQSNERSCRQHDISQDAGRSAQRCVCCLAYVPAGPETLAVGVGAVVGAAPASAAALTWAPALAVAMGYLVLLGSCARSVPQIVKVGMPFRLRPY
jgi:hypothetical protein